MSSYQYDTLSLIFEFAFCLGCLGIIFLVFSLIWLIKSAVQKNSKRGALIILVISLLFIIIGCTGIFLPYYYAPGPAGFTGTVLGYFARVTKLAGYPLLIVSVISLVKSIEDEKPEKKFIILSVTALIMINLRSIILMVCAAMEDDGYSLFGNLDCVLENVAFLGVMFLVLSLIWLIKSAVQKNSKRGALILLGTSMLCIVTFVFAS